MGGFLSFLQIKSHLKGRKAKKIEEGDEELNIVNQDDQKISVSKPIGNQYFKNCKVDNIITNIFSDLKLSDRAGLTIEYQDQKRHFNKTQLSEH